MKKSYIFLIFSWLLIAIGFYIMFNGERAQSVFVGSLILLALYFAEEFGTK